MKKIVFTIIVATLGISNITLADTFQKHMYCSKPSKPYNFTSEAQYNRFVDDVNKYQSCINDFVEEQNRGIKNHQKSINNAIEEWNRFVQFELK
ncbi:MULTISPECIES: hypothetical protein [Psychrobacter]|jgi:hypothetical protein|uniref:hypothetical protein n=1 Tax=Psychrobacter TaxID=497 RepID=UPI001918D3E6|nr:MULTISPECIES: hypothetical protein [Psychrobacter]